MEAIRAQGEAADRLTTACTSHAKAVQRIDARPAIERILHRAFEAGAVTPTDMIHKLGRMNK